MYFRSGPVTYRALHADVLVYRYILRRLYPSVLLLIGGGGGGLVTVMCMNCKYMELLTARYYLFSFSSKQSCKACYLWVYVCVCVYNLTMACTQSSSCSQW